MTRVVAIRRKRIVRTTHRDGRVTIAVRGVDIQVKPSRTARSKG